MLLTAAVLSSGIELPANAAELTEAVLVKETQEETETVLEETQEETELVSEEKQELTETETEEILSIIETGDIIDDIIIEETDFAEETILVEEQENAASYTYPTGGFRPQDPQKPVLLQNLLPGGKGYWTFDSTTGTLTVSGKGEFHSSYTTAVPWEEYQDQIKTAVISLTGTKNFSDLLYNCKNLTSVDLSKTDTSNAVNMNGMFMNCDSLEKLDISSFNTSKVTNMKYMFRECRSLKQLTFGTNFKTNNVTDMERMFTNVRLESLDLSNFDMAKVTSSEKMISSRSILEIKTPRNLNVSVPFVAGTWLNNNGTVITELPKKQSTSVLVKQRPTLKAKKTKKTYDVGEKLDLSDLTVELAYNDDFLISDRREIKNYTTNAASINMNTAGTKDLIISYQGQSVTIKLTVMKRTLLVKKTKTAYYLGESLNIDDLDVTIRYEDGSVYLVSEKDYTTNKDSINMNTVGTKDLIVKYEGVSATVKITVEERSFTYSNLQVKNAKPTYYANEKFDRSELTVTVNRKNSIRNETVTVTDYTTNVDKLSMSTPGTKTLTISYQGLTASMQITVEPPFTWEVMPGFGTFRHVYEIGEKPDFSNMQIVFCYSTGGTFGTTDYETNINQIDMSTPGKKTLHITYEFANMTMETDTDIFVIDKFRDDDIKHGKRNTLAYRLDKNGNLTIAGIGGCQFGSSNQLWWADGCDLDSVKTVKMIMSDAYGIGALFSDCSNLESADLSGLDTDKTMGAYLNGMFRRCYKLKSVNLNRLDTSNVSTMQYMFQDCKSLTSLDLSGFDASKVTDAYGMFSGCSALTSLRTPKNLSLNSMPKLPAGENEYWHDQNGKIYTCLPKGLSTSILLTKDTMPEEESSAVPESSKVEESSSAKESSKVEESSYTKESSKVEESSSVIESSKVEESSSAIESSKVEGSSDENESSKVEESSETQEDPPSEEHSKVVESSETEESSASKESSKTEESSAVKESSKIEESSKVEESSSVTESSKAEESSSVIESSKVEESSDESESTSENESSKTDLNAVGGTLSPVKAKVYDQNAYEPPVKVTVVQNRKKITLTEGVDYEVSYQNNRNAGTGTIFVKGNGMYKGTLKTTFAITQKSVKKLKIFTGSMAVGAKTKPPIYVYDGTALLKEGTDYKLSYNSDLTSKATKSAKITVIGLGNYKDSKAIKLTVYEGDASHIITPKHVTLNQQRVEYTGKAWKPAPVVIINGTTLTANKDYKVHYQNNINAGYATVIVSGKGAYKGEVAKTFKITALKAANAKLTITPIPDKTYNGTLQKPSVTVKSGTKKLVKNKDYTVTYNNNLHASTASQKAMVIITGKGNYAGITATAEFTILPQKISKSSVKGTMKNLMVSYNKTQLVEGTHYEITPDTSGTKKNKVKVTITGLGDFAESSVTKTIKVQ